MGSVHLDPGRLDPGRLVPERLVLENVPQVAFYGGGKRCPEDFCWPSSLRAALEYLGDRQVGGLGPNLLEVGPRGVEMGVVQDDLAGSHDRAGQDAFGSAALVDGQHMGMAGQAPDHRLESLERGGSSVALVTLHQG